MNFGTPLRSVLPALFVAAAMAPLGCHHSEDGATNTTATQGGPCGNRREASFSSCHDQAAPKGNESSGNAGVVRPPTQKELALVKERVPEARVASMAPPPPRIQLPPPPPPPRRPPQRAPGY